MDFRTFQANTMSAALAEVKHEMGPGAVILHTRSFYKNRWLGLRKREIFEITASREPRVGSRGSKPQVRPAPMPAQVKPLVDTRGQLLASSASQNAAMIGLMQEVTGLKGMVKELVIQSSRMRTPEIPEELFDFYSRLIQSQVAEELAGDMIRTLQKQIRPEHARQPDFVRMKLAEQIERLLPSSGPIVRTKTVGPHVVALIGPTGVGKTTTIAKLAANLQLREKRRVGLITLDTYRIAAIDQLRKYAEIICSPLKVVGTAEETAAAVRSMSDCDFILIDTAGRSPNDALKLSELKGLLAAARPDEVHLVLSTTASQQCVELAIARFSEVRVDKIIFTKLDEAAHVGVVLNVVHKINKSLSYVTTGQDVPDDIEVGQPRRLAQLILSGPTQ
ncbi:MAG TPA: flagellar biosynthesis protein FlhF [Tepidisphaeraceae bacterium]|jgi:flagellar biosynthesis protein FlhF|nr:flagellar biosynthesis protein FlhF [Tepidisphaeraceae bacterium]